MPRAAFVFVTTTVALLACGGSPPPVAVGVAAVTLDGGAAPAAPVQSPGPTSTTDALGGGGGTKLTPLGSGDAGADGGKKIHGELGRTVADLRAIVATHRDETRACYDNALANHPGIEGTIDVRWTIDPKGVVTDADIDTSKSEFVEPAVANCLIAIVKKIHFNVSGKGFETKAHYPFNFHPHAKHTIGDTTN